MKVTKYDIFDGHRCYSGHDIIQEPITWRQAPYKNRWNPLLDNIAIYKESSDIIEDRFFDLFHMYVENSLDLINDICWQASPWRCWPVDPTEYIASAVRTTVSTKQRKPKDELVERFAKELIELLSCFGPDWVYPSPNKPKQNDGKGFITCLESKVNKIEDLAEDGMLWLDNRVALFIEDKFKLKDLANTIQSNARERFSAVIEAKVLTPQHFRELFLWWDREPFTQEAAIGPKAVDWAKYHIPRYVFTFAAILWRTEFQPQPEQEKRKLPAIAYPIANRIRELCFEPGREVRSDGDRSELVSARGEVLAEIPSMAANDLPVLQSAFRQLSSLTGHRTIRFLVQEGHRQAAEGRADPHIIHRLGGLAAFAEAIGANSKKAQEEVGEVLKAGSSLQLVWPGGEWNGLWMYGHESKSARGRQAWVRLELASFLMPHFAKRWLPVDQQQLVPLVPLPPFVGSRQLHAAQAALQFGIVAALVAHRAELLPHGGALFREGELERLARESGLDAAHLPRVLDRWTQDGDDGPMFLERVGKDRYMLANTPPYADGRAFLLEGSKRSIAGKKAGQKAVKNKTRRNESGFRKR